MSDSKQHISSETAERIRNVVDTGWKDYNRSRKIGILLGSAATFLLLLWFLIMLEFLFWMDPALRTLLLAATIGASVWIFVKLTSSLRKTSFSEFYRNFSRKDNSPEIRYLLDLMHDTREDKPALFDAALEQSVAKIDATALAPALRQHLNKSLVAETRRTSTLAFFSGLTLVLIFGFFQQDSLIRVFTPWATYFPPNPYTYFVTPSDTTVEQGTRLRIDATFHENAPREVILAFKTDAESEFRQQRMEPTDEGIFSSDPNQLFSSIQFYLLMDGFRSEFYRANVQLLPRFSELSVKVQPPSYTRLESTEYSYPFGRIEVYPGSELQIFATANQPLAEAKLYAKSASDYIKLESADSRNFSMSKEIAQPDSIWFKMRDDNGLTNRNTFSFNVHTKTDEYPEVRFLRPDPVVSKLEPEDLTLVYELSDDFGFRSVRLHYEIERSFGSGAPQQGSIRLSTPAERIAVEEFLWEITPLNLLPMDILTYWLIVSDNDTFAGFKEVRSATQTLKISSITDFLMAQEEMESDIASQFEDFSEAYNQAMQEFEELREQILSNPEENWEQSRIAEELREKREELAEKLEQIKQQFDDLSQSLGDSNSLSDETLAMYEDLRKLIDEIDDPEILKALEQLKQGLENLDQNAIRDALQKMEFNEERYKERLERTMELFKALQTNAEIDRMSAVLEDLANQEDALIGDNLPETEEQLQRQEHIQKELENLKDRLNKLPDNAPNRHKDNVEHLKNESLQDISLISEQLQKDIDDLKAQMESPGNGEGSEGGDGDGDSGGEGGSQSQERREEIRDRMMQMRQNLQNTRMMMGQQGIQINRQALLSIMQNLLQLSDAQENLLRETSELTQGSAGFIEMARRQRTVSRSFSMITDSLYQVSKELPAFPNRLNVRRAEIERNLERSVQLLAERDRNRSVAEERVSLGGMNEISSMLADLLNQLDNSDGGGGDGNMTSDQLMQQLNDMSGQQQQLNQQIQDLINDMAGERLMQDHMERLDQMARQQNAIRRQIQEIQRRGGLESGDNILSELQRISDEMEDAINDLRGGVTERVMVQRQQNILSRMLEAERALNERDLDDERRGDRPQDVDRVSPSQLTLEALREQIRRTLQDPNETRFSDEYQRLIQRYFELLEEAERRNR